MDQFPHDADDDRDDYEPEPEASPMLGPGDVVEALVNLQGLKRGQRYEVVATYGYPLVVEVLEVDWILRGLECRALRVFDAHLVLRRVGP